jgi:hypothetical protein
MSSTYGSFKNRVPVTIWRTKAKIIPHRLRDFLCKFFDRGTSKCREKIVFFESQFHGNASIINPDR